MTQKQSESPGLLRRLVDNAALVSAAVAITVAFFVHVDAQHSVRAQYVAVAVGILSAPKVDERPDLRGWATDVLDKLSDVKLTDKDRADLRAGRIILPVGAALISEGKDTDAGRRGIEAMNRTRHGFEEMPDLLGSCQIFPCGWRRDPCHSMARH
jgi:hypothetical protein